MAECVFTTVAAEGNLLRGPQAKNSARAYASDFKHFSHWCAAQGIEHTPPTHQAVGEYLAYHVGKLSVATLNRRLSAIKHYSLAMGVTLNGTDPAIFNVMRNQRKAKASAVVRSAALAPSHIRAMVRSLNDTLAGRRDRALILVGYAGALRRSELVGIDVEHVTGGAHGVSILIPRSKSDQFGNGATVEITFGSSDATCPVVALRSWLDASGIKSGPVFRKVDLWGNIIPRRLNGDAVRAIVSNAARAAGVTPPLLSRISPHCLRVGCVTAAHEAGESDGQIASHSRHASVEGMRDYIRPVCVSATTIGL